MSTTNIKFKRSSVAGKIPTIAQLDLGEIAINTNDGNLYLKREYFSESANTNIEEVVKFTGSIPVENTLYVQKAGSDENDGTSWNTAFATIEKAVEAATLRGELTLIDVGPGEYTTQGHIDMPDDCIIKGVYRTVYIKPEPGFEERNVFRMGSGCFIEGIVFTGFRIDDLDNPTEGFAAVFRPDALITRTPYVHKIVVRTDPTWTTIAPPLDRENANPYVGRGAGVVLADGLVCSPYSVYPNIMTWGATPVSHNGIGYCAKNGALINAVNAISIWAHKHFLALSGGQIILSSCSTQFGDFTMVSSGSRNLILPTEVDVELTIQSAAAAAINTNRETIIDNMWDALVAGGYTATWDAEDELYTRRDANSFLQSMIWVLDTANEKPMLDFAKGLFDVQGNAVFTGDKLAAFIFSFNNMRDQIKALADVNATADALVDELVDALNTTISDPVTTTEPSTITAIGHTWTAIMAGVALTKIPPARNFATIEESIIETNNGIVIASGQDDQGSALFIGGMKIDSDTGELSGPPFDQAVNRIATRSAIARSF
jgi:hypothetical protein